MFTEQNEVQVLLWVRAMQCGPDVAMGSGPHGGQATGGPSRSLGFAGSQQYPELRKPRGLHAAEARGQSESLLFFFQTQPLADDWLDVGMHKDDAVTWLFKGNSGARIPGSSPGSPSPRDAGSLLSLRVSQFSCLHNKGGNSRPPSEDYEH